MVDLPEPSPICTQHCWSSARVINGFLVTSHTQTLFTKFHSGIQDSWTSSILKWWHPLSSLPWSVQQELVCSLLQNSCSWALEGVLLPLWLFFSLIASCETLYRRVCFFPNHVQSVWFTTRGTNLSVNASTRHPKLNPPPPKKTQKSLKTFQLHCKSCFLTYGEWKQL